VLLDKLIASRKKVSDSTCLVPYTNEACEPTAQIVYDGDPTTPVFLTRGKF
jgi:hypothetical protein